ncbi:MAG TPA: hypothetical protein VIK18_20880, partial [Pirellulales bacterium]
MATQETFPQVAGSEEAGVGREQPAPGVPPLPSLAGNLGYDPTRGRPLLRIADRFLGIPLLAAGSLVKRRRPRPQRLDTIHMLRTAGIGDTVLLLGALVQVREVYPQALLRVFLGSSNAAMAPFFPADVEVIVLPVTRPLSSLATLRRYPCDVMLDFG